MVPIIFVQQVAKRTLRNSLFGNSQSPREFFKTCVTFDSGHTHRKKYQQQQGGVYPLCTFKTLFGKLIQIELLEREQPKQKPPFCRGIQMRRFEGITNSPLLCCSQLAKHTHTHSQPAVQLYDLNCAPKLLGTKLLHLRKNRQTDYRVT